MAVELTIICVAVALLATAALVKRLELERHTITPEELRVLLASNTDAFVVDAREPLDLLGDSVIIPGEQYGLLLDKCLMIHRSFRQGGTWWFIVRARMIRPTVPSCIER